VAARAYGEKDRALARWPTVKKTIDDATVCIRNHGKDTYLIGTDVGAGNAAIYRPSGEVLPPFVRIRLDYSESAASSWWSYGPEAAGRFWQIKATFLGSWTMWVVLGALLAVALSSIWYAARVFAR
jgi:hypothetical protein